MLSIHASHAGHYRPISCIPQTNIQSRCTAIVEELQKISRYQRRGEHCLIVVATISKARAPLERLDPENGAWRGARPHSVIYLTYDPRPGRTDAERNWISNVRTDGISYELAAHKLQSLIQEARVLKLSGVALKEDARLLA